MDIAKQSSLTVVAARAGMDEDQIADCLLAMDTDEVKDSLRKMTDEAVEEGAFGLPYIVTKQYNKEDSYFGSDRFEIMAARLGVQWLGPVPDPEGLKEIPMPPAPDQVDLHERLADAEAIKFEAGDELKSMFKGVPLRDDPDADDNATKMPSKPKSKL